MSLPAWVMKCLLPILGFSGVSGTNLHSAIVERRDASLTRPVNISDPFSPITDANNNLGRRVEEGWSGLCYGYREFPQTFTRGMRLSNECGVRREANT